MEDARLEEIAYLKKAAERLCYMESPHPEDSFDRRMIVELIAEGALNGPGSVSFLVTAPQLFGTVGFRQDEHAVEAMGQVLAGQSTKLCISHKGRVRLARLLSEMQSLRGRDPSGLVWSKRHQDDDLRIAIIYCAAAAPVAVAYMDMNGLKAINDTHGHDAGDQAIKLYLETVAGRSTKEIEAYRGDSSDEVVVIFRNTSLDQAADWVRKTLRSLGGQVYKYGPLRAACGLLACPDDQQNAKKLIATAESLMYQAKGAKDTGESGLVMSGIALERIS